MRSKSLKLGEGMKLDLRGEVREIEAKVSAKFGSTPPLPIGMKYKMSTYQLQALFGLALEVSFRIPGAAILEIGTGFGSSTIQLSRAAPRSEIISLTISEGEATAAREHLRRYGCRNAKVVVDYSWDFLTRSPKLTDLKMVFVDGDHNAIRRDMPWFNRLLPGGLFFCHDYSDNPGNVVVQEMDLFRDRLGRDFDIYLKDTSGAGMVGFYRGEGEHWK